MIFVTIPRFTADNNTIGVPYTLNKVGEDADGFFLEPGSLLKIILHFYEYFHPKKEQKLLFFIVPQTLNPKP